MTKYRQRLAMANAPDRPRKRLPKQVAVIDADHCTGCAACVEVCPVDCIQRFQANPEMPGLGDWFEIDWDRCIGCKLCIRLPRKKTDATTLLVCPWEAISMVPIADLATVASDLGGPPELRGERDTARRQSAERQISRITETK